MTDDIDDEFRRIVASQLADLDMASLDDLDFDERPAEPHDPPATRLDTPTERSDPPTGPTDPRMGPPRGDPPGLPEPPVRSEWPVRSASNPPAVRPAPPGVVPPPPGPRSWTPAPEPDDFVPPPPLPPAKRPSAVAWTAISSIGAGVVLLGGVVLGWLAGSWATPVGFLMLCSGLVVLFTRLPRDRDPGSDNGARV